MIAELRMELGLSQAQLADRVNKISGKCLTRWDVSRWEAGRRVPVGDIPALAVALDVAESVLDEAAEEARRARRPDTVTADALEGVLLSHRKLEDTVGSRVVLPAAIAHQKQAETVLREARGVSRDRLASVASSSAQFSGWLTAYLRQFGKADRFYDKALRIALEANDDDAASTALAMRGHLAWMRDDVGEMIALSRAARKLAVRPATKTIATQQQARAHALEGDEVSALRLFDAAEESYDPEATAPDSAYFYSPPYLMMQRGIVMFYLGRFQDAAALIGQGLAELPEEIRNAEWMDWYKNIKADAEGGGRKLATIQR
ncbi:helix-turn-helix transcriptional regulator [Nonomuraea sp. NPDC050328]|uniref:helix-turn-helix transcriptional regulator n=1 Tax=Nonomuraea sp. NPDC050328 TaxID=3364361 RepID=UPI00379B3363